MDILEVEMMRSSTYSFEEASLLDKSKKSLVRQNPSKKGYLRPSASEKAPRTDRSSLSDGSSRKAELE